MVSEALRQEFKIVDHPVYSREDEQCPFYTEAFQQSLIHLASELTNRPGLLGLGISTRTKDYFPATYYDAGGRFRYAVEVTDGKINLQKNHNFLRDVPVAMKGLITMHQTDPNDVIAIPSLSDIAMLDNPELANSALEQIISESCLLSDRLATEIHGEGAWALQFINIDRATAYSDSPDHLDDKQAIKALHIHVLTNDSTLKDHAKEPFLEQIKLIRSAIRNGTSLEMQSLDDTDLIRQVLRSPSGGFMMMGPRWLLSNYEADSNPNETAAILFLSDSIHAADDSTSFLKDNMTAFTQAMYQSRFKHLRTTS